MNDTLVALSFFLLFNLVAVASVIFSQRKKWRIDLTEYRHYTALIFNVCGIIYALFLGFVIWDVWERFYDVKQTTQNEGKALIDLYRDSTVFPESGEEPIQAKLKAYLEHVIHTEWRRLENGEVTDKGDQLVNAIWDSYYAYAPKTRQEQVWYDHSIDKLSAFSNARMLRIFNATPTVGGIRWTLLILGGLVLITIPCFFKVDYFAFKLVLTLFLANIIAFMLFITYSLDHPFTGYGEITPAPFQYALQMVQPW